MISGDGGWVIASIPLFSCCLHGSLIFLSAPLPAKWLIEEEQGAKMVSLLNAISIASVFAASAALRFRLWKQPYTLLFYFLFFWLGESLLHRFFIPEIAMGIEVAYVCFSITAALVLACVGLHKYESKTEPD